MDKIMRNKLNNAEGAVHTPIKERRYKHGAYNVTVRVTKEPSVSSMKHFVQSYDTFAIKYGRKAI